MYIALNAKGGNIGFIATYAPTAESNTEDKENFYDTLTMAINEIKGIYYIGGDFNARIYNRREDEKEVIGQYIIEREPGYVANKMNPDSLENRSMFISNLKSHEHCAINTMFQKTSDKLITYIEKKPENNHNIIIQNAEWHNPIPNLHVKRRTLGPPYDYTKYAQCDYLITRREWMSSVIDAQSRRDIYTETDHILIEMKIRCILEYTKTDKTEKCKKKHIISQKKKAGANTTNKLETK